MGPMRVGRLVRSTAVALCLLASSFAPAANRAQPSEEELRALRERIGQLQKGLAAAEESRGEAAEQLKASSQAVSEARRTLFELARQRQDIEAGLAGIAARERAARESIARQKELAGRLLRLQYEQGSPDRLRLLLEGRDAASVGRHLAYYDYIQRARGAVIEALAREATQLAALEAEAEAHRAELAANEAQQASETARLENERTARAAVVQKLAGDIAQGRREIGRLKRDEARLSKLVAEIARALAAPTARRNTAPPGHIEDAADASSSSRAF